ncbi:MAG: acetate uptake transporter [Bacteroidales bacterium]|jgi:succinate-acetate transporter protein|nr:acetate uptake transporter [Bacteroidales bacterium]
MMHETYRITENTTNPAPLGLAGFGMSTLLLNLHNAGLFGMDTMILAMGIFFGGIAQILVGKMEWKKNNMFGLVAFSSYGFFWITLVFLMLLPKLGLGEAPSAISMGWFLTAWGIFSVGLFIATFRMTMVMRVLFGSVVALFFLLAAADFTGFAPLKTTAGLVGIFSGCLALFISLSMVINDTHGREVVRLR